MRNTVVVFNEFGARIYEGAELKDFKGRSDTLINPVFPKGVSPSYWKRTGTEISEMSASEKEEVDAKRDLRLRDHRIVSFEFTDAHRQQMIDVTTETLRRFQIKLLGILVLAFAALSIMQHCIK